MKRSPFPIPFGWFQMGWATDVAVGETKPIKYFGKHLVLWRDEQGTPHVQDAFCLHPVPDGAVAALRGLTLQVAAGERVVVHGPNGSGKTTLLQVLAGRQRLSAGRAVVAGADVGRALGRRDRRALARWRASRLGWVDQHPARTLRPELGGLANVALQLRLAGVSRDFIHRTSPVSGRPKSESLYRPNLKELRSLKEVLT